MTSVLPFAAKFNHYAHRFFWWKLFVMESPENQQPDFDKAIASAREALGKEFSWIRKSAGLESAYYAGLYAGLETLASEKTLKQLLLTGISDTLWARSGDDTFTTTKVGRVYQSIETDLRREAVDPQTSVTEKLAALFQLVEKLDAQWQHNLRDTKELLSACQTIAEELAILGHAPTDSEEGQRQHELLGELHRLRDHLERCLRIVALLETDHRLWSRFDEES